MTRMKLATKIVLIVVLAVSIVLISAFSYLAVTRRNQDLNFAHRDSEAIAKENAAQIKVELSQALDSARALAQALGAYEGFPGESRRDILSGIIQEIADQNAWLLGAWACFEENALDGMDYFYRNTAGHDDTGRFIPNWYRSGDGIELAPLVDYDVKGAGDYYLLAFDSGRETVLEPYEYEVSGKQVLLTTFSVPIRNTAGKVVGVAGVDISLDTLNQMNFNAGEYNSAHFYLLSNEGVYIIHGDNTVVGKNLSVVEPQGDKAAPMLEAIKAGLVYADDSLSEMTGKPCLKTLVPITLGDTQMPWSAGLSVDMQEITAESNANFMLLILILVVVLAEIAAVIYISVMRIIKKPLAQLVEVAQQQARGNYDIDIKTNRQDELGQLFQSLKSVNDNMNELLTNLKNAAEQVAAGAREISTSSANLSQGASEQASSIEQLTASIEEIAAQTKSSVEHADSANGLAISAKTYAENGNAHMTQLLDAMHEINDSSANISKIIKVIDDIAFQTNILALNAAVEAARAGQHGKGFAVVAEEVRNLAAKSAEAAKQTTALIEESIAKADGGGRIAGQTAEALANIVNEISNAATLVNEISMASNEQASAISQINQGITQVSQVVQANSSTAQQSAAASEELSGQAEVLMDQVSKFKLRDSADLVAQIEKPQIPAQKKPRKENTAKSDVSINLGGDYGKY